MKFRVWCPEESGSEDDAREFEAHDAEDAAEQWAERDDWSSAEYQIVGSRWTPVVCVLGPDGVTRRFTVSGEAVPSYIARETS